MTQSTQPFDALKENLLSSLEAPIESKLKRPLKICPVCGGQTMWEGVHLICNNSNCIGQLIKQTAYFYSKTGIDLNSIAENMIAKLILDPAVFKIIVNNPWALLDPISFKLTPLILKIWGEARTDTFLENLQKINNRKNAAHFIAALGYPGLAYKTVLKIFYFIQEGIISSFIPKKAQKSFLDAYIIFERVKPQLPNFIFTSLPKSPKLRYCITGTLATPRVEIIDYLTKLRWEWSGQVSSYVDYLIIGSNPGQIKITMAKEKGIPTLTESEFMEMIKGAKK